MSIVRIPLSRIEDNPYQPRTTYAGIEELADSIEEDGLLQYPVARLAKKGVHYSAVGFDTTEAVQGLLEDDPDVVVQLAYGHRRIRALRRLAERRDDLGADWTVPIRLKPLDDEAMARQVGIENAGRENLDPIERARYIELLRERFGYTMAQVGELFGKARSTISNWLRILKLPTEVQEHVAEGRITERQAHALVPIYDLEIDADTLDTIVPETYLRPKYIVASALDGHTSERLREVVTRLCNWVEERERRQAEEPSNTAVEGSRANAEDPDTAETDDVLELPPHWYWAESSEGYDARREVNGSNLTLWAFSRSTAEEAIRKARSIDEVVNYHDHGRRLSLAGDIPPGWRWVCSEINEHAGRPIFHLRHFGAEGFPLGIDTIKKFIGLLEPVVEHAWELHEEHELSGETEVTETTTDSASTDAARDVQELDSDEARKITNRITVHVAKQLKPEFEVLSKPALLALMQTNNHFSITHTAGYGVITREKLKKNGWSAPKDQLAWALAVDVAREYLTYERAEDPEAWTKRLQKMIDECGLDIEVCDPEAEETPEPVPA